MYYPPGSSDPSAQNNQPTQQNQFPAGFNPYMQNQYAPPPPVPGQFQHPSQLPKKPGLGNWFARQTRGAKIGMGCGVLLLTMTVCLCSTVAFAGNQAATHSSTSASSSTTQQAATASISHVQNTSTVLVSPTSARKSTNTNAATATVKPATPTIIPSPTPVPTRAVPPTAVPTHVAQPTPVKSGVNGNPWGYDFNAGNYITTPPTTFCNYFTCIASFWNGRGYVMECQDGTYSLSGGHRGSCSHHRGNLQALYSH